MDKPQLPPKCPACGSMKVVKAGQTIKKGQVAQRLKCSACGRHFT